MEHLVLEVGLALGLIVVAALISWRLRFSVVPFLILVGMAVGPHAPKIGPLDFRFIDSAPLIEFMGRVGVLFLLFYLGLEFSVSRLFKSGRSIVVGGSIYNANQLRPWAWLRSVNGLWLHCLEIFLRVCLPEKLQNLAQGPRLTWD